MVTREEKVLLSNDGLGRVAIVKRTDGLFCIYAHWMIRRCAHESAARRGFDFAGIWGKHVVLMRSFHVGRQSVTQPAEILYAVPVGTIIAWYPLPDAQLPPGFAYCDGERITDDDSPYKGMSTPDLVNRFVLGTGNGVAVNQQGGSTSYNVGGWQSGTIETSPTQVSLPQDDVQNNIILREGATSGYRYELTSDHDEWNDGNHHHQIASLTVPAPGWLALVYLMRIK